MRIIHINASYKPAYIYGGPTMSVSKLCEELEKVGTNVEVYTTTANGERELKVKAGIRTNVDGVSVTYFRRLTKGNSHFSPALLLSLWNILRIHKSAFENKPSTFSHPHVLRSPVVHIHAWWNLVSVGACTMALWKSKMVILSPRGTLSNYSFGNRTSILKNIFHQILGKELLKRCHYHVSSEKEKQDILNIIKPKSITVIPNFVNLGSTVKNANCKLITDKSLPFQILFFSRVEEKKGLDILFHALLTLGLDYHLTIAGTGHSDYINFLKSLASNLGIINRISWIGHQNNEQKFEILAAHDLMILPSYDESFANVVVESLSVGTPVLISNRVGLADYVVAKNLGWVCDHSPANYRDTLETAFQNQELRKKIRREAPAQIALDFNDKYLVIQYLQLYQNILTYT